MAPPKGRSVDRRKVAKISVFQRFCRNYVSIAFVKSLVLDPSRLPIVSVAIVLAEIILNVIVVQNVPYTEIDWIAYMQECEGFLNGTMNYALLKGDTGPLVYPAGFVYIYSGLYLLTSHGQNVRLAQYIFIGIYIAQLCLVLRIYSRSLKVPPYVMAISIFTSYRIHSIYVLRLFNDPIAILFLYLALNLFLSQKWTYGSLFFSLAVSVKMNILLFAPAVFLLYLTNLGYLGTLKQLVICAILQLWAGAPFLLTYPYEYIKGSFDLGRVFEHKWTVNYRFLDRAIFERKEFHITLLVLHLLLLCVFASPCYRYLQSYCRLKELEKQFKPQIARENAKLAKSKNKSSTKSNSVTKKAEEKLTKEQEQFLDSFEKSLKISSGNASQTVKQEMSVSEEKNDQPPAKLSVQFGKTDQLALLPLFLSNFIGIVCARSLHYQFYVWYFHSLPYLTWCTDYTLGLKFLILGVIEYCWNSYPSTNFSSALLHCCHIVLLYGIANDLTYDFALSRLGVVNEDSWRGIQPSSYGSDYNPEPPLFSAKFANCKNYRHILALANEDGKIALQDTTLQNDKDTEQALAGQQCHYNAVFDVEWVPGQMKFVSASGDHTARLWEINESEIIQSRIFNGHTRSVKTAAFRKMDSAVFATGGRDGAILIWDTRATLNYNSLPRADNCIYSGHAGGPGTPVSNKKRAKTPKICPNNTSSSITGLVFQDDYTLISCGAGDGIIKVWDLRRNYTTLKKEPLPKHSLPYAGSSTFKAFTNLLIDESGVKLYANCMDNKIYCYNLSSYSTKPVQTYTGFRNSTFYIKSALSPDGNYLISGSGDEKAYIWNVNSPQPVVTLNGHTVEVTCVAWSAAGDMPIVTCSDDARHMIWRIGPEKISADDKLNYKGHAEYCEKYKNVQVIEKLKALEHTPRSLRRLVERNEKTPSTVEKITLKRPFSEVCNDPGPDSGSAQKRPHYEITRGRRLFSPSTSQGIRSGPEHRCLTSIIEEVADVPPMSPVLSSNPDDSSNQENPPISASIHNSISPVPNKVVSPLSERTVFNLNPSENTVVPIRPIPSTSTASPSSLLFSPTSNLPNYVIDGEAPHLRIMSPKRKIREKVDWLTKIRKQKLMSCRRSGTTITEKLNSTQNGHDRCDSTNEVNTFEVCMSPRLQSLKAEDESSPKTTHNNTPKRRSSRSNSNSELSHGPCSQQKTPRRNSETSILRFFSILSHSHQSQTTVTVTTPTASSTTATTGIN